jgi:predicted transcriptional regulator of viral defense system
MKWESFVNHMKGVPVVLTENLRTRFSSFGSMAVQLGRWHNAGKLIQLKRGVYLIAEPYRKVEIHEPFLAQTLKHPSYISLEKALEFHGLIPEAVPVYTSVTTKRPGRFVTEIGSFDYRHIQRPFFWGYESVERHGQIGFVAMPEKALLDFFYLNRVAVTESYLREMRLQNTEKVNLKRLTEFASHFNKAPVKSAATTVARFIREMKKGERKL